MDRYKKMTEEEISKRDPLMRYTHPARVLSDLFELIKKIGSKEFLESAGLNKERDAFFGCMFALAMRSYQGREFYMQQVNDPPDFELIAPTDRTTKEQPFDHLNVEVVTIPIEIDQQTDKFRYTTDLIERTKLGKKYEAGTILLIFVKGACGLDIFPELRDWVQNNPIKFDNFGEIMIMFLTETNPFIYKVGSLSEQWEGNFKLSEEFKKPLIEHPLIDKYGVNVERNP